MPPELPQANQVPTPPAQPELPLPTPPSTPKRWLPWVLAALVLIVVSATAGAVGYQAFNKEKVDSVNSSTQSTPTVAAELPLAASLEKMISSPVVSTTLTPLVETVTQVIAQQKEPFALSLGESSQEGVEIVYGQENGEIGFIVETMSLSGTEQQGVAVYGKFAAEEVEGEGFSHQSAVSIGPETQLVFTHLPTLLLQHAGVEYRLEFREAPLSGRNGPVLQPFTNIPATAIRAATQGQGNDAEGETAYSLYLAPGILIIFEVPPPPGINVPETEIFIVFDPAIEERASNHDYRCVAGIPPQDCKILVDLYEQAEGAACQSTQTCIPVTLLVITGKCTGDCYRVADDYELDDFPPSKYLTK